MKVKVYIKKFDVEDFLKSERSKKQLKKCFGGKDEKRKGNR